MPGSTSVTVLSSLVTFTPSMSMDASWPCMSSRFLTTSRGLNSPQVRVPVPTCRGERHCELTCPRFQVFHLDFAVRGHVGRDFTALGFKSGFDGIEQVLDRGSGPDIKVAGHGIAGVVNA